LLTHPTLDQLHQLGLAGMASAFAELQAAPQTVEMTHAEWLALLLDRELTERRDRRLKARLRYARLRHHATIGDVDYRAPRGLDRSLFQKLAAGDWIDAPQNLIIAASAMAAVPTIVFFLIFQRNIMAGLTAGGIRG